LTPDDSWRGADPYPEDAAAPAPRLNRHRRLPSETVSIVLELPGGAHRLDVSLCRDARTGELREIVFVGRGKIGSGLDLMLHDLGVKLSRAIQNRHPDTGAPA
jgi:hypothetical protein